MKKVSVAVIADMDAVHKTLLKLDTYADNTGEGFDLAVDIIDKLLDSLPTSTKVGKILISVIDVKEF